MINNWEEKNFEGIKSDLQLCYCGRRLKNVGHSFGPYRRSDYLIYYIEEGTADLELENEHILISGKSIFVNFPHSGAFYRSNETEPWSIRWISAAGELVGNYLELIGITPEHPFLSIENGHEIELLFEEMYEAFDNPSLASRIYCVSLLHKLFSLLSANRERHTGNDLYTARAMSMIESNYSDPSLTVSSIADALHLHPNYFSILFKRETGIRPKNAILEVRMRAARKMLRFTDCPIKEISASVGFSNQLYFSRIFHSRYGITPTAYRQGRSYPI